MRLISVVIVLIACLASCSAEQELPAPALVLINNSDIRLQLAPGNAPVETPLSLQLAVKDAIDVTGELTGISMFMGRIPLRFLQVNGLWQADFLLGACSDPQMMWQLEMTIHFANEEKRTVKQQFQSSW